MLIESPCHYCEDRVLHCHAHCDRYKEYRAKLEKLKELQKSEKQLTEFRCEEIRRYRRIRDARHHRRFGR